MLTTTAYDRDLADLRAAAQLWRLTPLAEKLDLLRQVRANTATAAGEWVRLSCAGKGLDLGSPLAGEEWFSGPYALLTGVAALSETLEMLIAGRNPLDGVKSRTLPNGQTALRVFPLKAEDHLLMGHRAEVWLRPGVSLADARSRTARRLMDTKGPGKVALVLGAGNINSIAPLDALGELFGNGAVALVKMNPVNEYLAPVLNEVFAPLVKRGFVRVVTGGADAGAYLVNHPEVDSVHITGSAASHDAIVFGPGPEGAARKTNRQPVLTKPISSELGGVGPAVVVPGKWSRRALRAQARHIVTQRLHNSGFNCVATQIVVLAESWPQREQFVRYLRDAMEAAPARPAYYPGAADRQTAAIDTHLDCEIVGGGDKAAPRTLLFDLDAEDYDDPAFRGEYFAPVLGVTTLPGDTPAQFLRNAVDFCNDTLEGSLGVNVLAAPRTKRRLGADLDRAVADLRYGTVAVNTWVAPIFAMPRATWGGFPGADIINPDSGIGVVHNALLIDPDQIERSVGQGPFRQWPKPLWFVDNRTTQISAERLTRVAAEPNLVKALPNVLKTFAAALRG